MTQQGDGWSGHTGGSGITFLSLPPISAQSASRPCCGQHLVNHRQGRLWAVGWTLRSLFVDWSRPASGPLLQAERPPTPSSSSWLRRERRAEASCPHSQPSVGGLTEGLLAHSVAPVKFWPFVGPQEMGCQLETFIKATLPALPRGRAWHQAPVPAGLMSSWGCGEKSPQSGRMTSRRGSVCIWQGTFSLAQGAPASASPRANPLCPVLVGSGSSRSQAGL